MISEYIKNKLNVLLHEKSLSQKMLAKTIGVHQAQISMFASGSRSITMEFAEKFFRAYPTYFFKELPEPDEKLLNITAHNKPRFESHHPDNN